MFGERVRKETNVFKYLRVTGGANTLDKLFQTLQKFDESPGEKKNHVNDNAV